MKNELTIELVPWSQLESQEVRHVQQLFSSEGISINVSSSVYVRKAAEVPPIIQIVIVAPFVWFAKGFFTRMGEEHVGRPKTRSKEIPQLPTWKV